MSSLVPALIRKDLEMSLAFPLLAFATGCGALALFYFGGEPLAIAGIVAFFIVLVMLGVVPMVLILNERKKQTLAFVMSLPVSASQYAFAKLAAALGMFVVPWLLLVGLALALIVGTSDVPNGVIPLFVMLALLPLIGFLVSTSVAIVFESDLWSNVTMGAVHISYSFVWITVISIPGLLADVGSPVPVWNETVLTALAIELGLIAAIFGLTLALQSRKRDFI
jgi:ABC-type transport system involved in multi-copper enzyme maturation permease subunit